MSQDFTERLDNIEQPNFPKVMAMNRQVCTAVLLTTAITALGIVPALSAPKPTPKPTTTAKPVAASTTKPVAKPTATPVAQPRTVEATPTPSAAPPSS